MISLSLKTLIGAGVAGAIGAGGYGIYIVSQKEETILDSLSKKNLTLLKVEGEEDNSEWEKKVEAHKTEGSIPKLSGYTPKADGTDEEKKRANVDSMKNICKDLVREFSKDSSKLAQAEKWCVKDKLSS